MRPWALLLLLGCAAPVGPRSQSEVVPAYRQRVMGSGELLVGPPSLTRFEIDSTLAESFATLYVDELPRYLRVGSRFDLVRFARAEKEVPLVPTPLPLDGQEHRFWLPPPGGGIDYDWGLGPYWLLVQRIKLEPQLNQLHLTVEYVWWDNKERALIGYGRLQLTGRADLATLAQADRAQKDAEVRAFLNGMAAELIRHSPFFPVPRQG